jgi:methionine synthase II (cobalamin-independent)
MPHVPIDIDTSPILQGEVAALANLQACARVNLIELHDPFRQSDEDSRRTALRAAKEVVEAAKAMEDTNEIYWHICTQVRVYIRLVVSKY